LLNIFLEIERRNLMEKPLILIINDDGISAPGIRSLISTAREMGRVIVVAPDMPRSGTGHAITVRDPLRFELISSEDNYEEYSCSGTPVDCVKIAERVILNSKPDILISGINHGSNASINVFYSGTMAAVLEGTLDEIPSIGFSLMDYSDDADFSSCGKYVKDIAMAVLKNGLPPGVCLNVNIPAVNGADIKGIKVCRQARGVWREKFDEQKDPRNNSYYWLKGEFHMLDNGEDTDDWALKNNFVSVVPVQIDLTAHHAVSSIKDWEFNA